MPKTADQRVDEAVALLADFETKLHELNERREQLMLTSIQEGESRAMDRIRAHIDSLTAKREAQN